MRHHDATMAGRWRKFALGGPLVLLALTTVLPAVRAQMSYKGGFIPTRRQSENAAPKPAAPQTTAPAAPKSLASFSPDNDFAYPAYYPAAGLQRPLLPLASLSPYGISPSDLPWNRAGFEDYLEAPRMPPDASLVEAKKYSLTATLLPPLALAERPEMAVLIARLPEHAALWVEGTRTRSLGRTRYFQSPPLLPDRLYVYTVRAAWIEDGRWVSQTRKVPVRAGLIQAIYLEPALPVKAAMKSLPK